MKYTSCVLLAVFILTACHSPHSKTGKGDPVSVGDFQEIFPSLNLSYVYTLDSLQTKEPDSASLKIAILNRFIPDSLLHKAFHKGEKIRYFPIGRIAEGTQRWILLKAQSTKTAAFYLFVWDKSGKLLNGHTIAQISRQHPPQLLWTRIESNKLLTVRERKPGDEGQTENVYTIEADGSQTLIMTNSSEPPNGDRLINPIDTFPRKNKYAADYMDGKTNIVSIRDGKESKTFLFFIHLNNDKENCSGELEGRGKFTSANVGEYHEPGGSCGIRFTFSASRVSIKEVGGCGAYRGIHCTFTGNFAKKKVESKKEKK